MGYDTLEQTEVQQLSTLELESPQWVILAEAFAVGSFIEMLSFIE
ncbi:hypothetical protein [Vibrio japonicus]|uniref:Uncharacterized protein n=1 Tax=Vibrio japonicus TaxID=1824638 RepID=A0ABY5LL23_9VIBR|nr:hypothetical protein [Vibrio japonicus]UUM32803.1 hypothetical protein NP165_14665 [Vibrio japonicus]